MATRVQTTITGEPIVIKVDYLLDLLQAALPCVRYKADDVYRLYANPGTDCNRLAGRIEIVMKATGRKIPVEDDDAS
jgi:phenylacetate-coenzyme A ligase PaaK-like adenylate-forming protein